MAINITKGDTGKGKRLIAQHDLYLDESRQRVIVVKDGADVPKEAAFVLAGKGGTIPVRYEKLLEQIKAEVKVEPEAQTQDEVRSEPPAAPQEEAKPEPQPRSAKPKSIEGKPE